MSDRGGGGGYVGGVSGGVMVRMLGMLAAGGDGRRVIETARESETDTLT